MGIDAHDPRPRAMMTSPMIDREERDVLARCVAQDPRAFRSFVARHERAVFALLSRMLGRGTHVEDLAQETFLRAFRAFPSFDLDGPAKPSTWLLTIAVRLALDARKKKAISLRPIAALGLRDEAHDAIDPATPETARARAELGRAIERAAETLPDDQRAALVLADFHGLTMSEIAEATSTPEATVKTRLFRARAKMREELGDWSDA